MRILLSMAALLLASTAAADQRATFRVDGVTSTPSTVVATIQPRPDAPGYSWLRIYFYRSLTATERVQAERGGIDAHRTHWAAVLQVSLDSQSTVWQLDLSIPGHACTIAASDREAQSVIQMFQYERGRVSLQTQGSHVCDLRSLNIPNQTFEWDVSVDAPVVESRSSGR